MDHFLKDPIFADLLNALGYAMREMPAPTAPDRDEPIPGSDAMEEE
jgi:hypothetical protein